MSWKNFEDVLIFKLINKVDKPTYYLGRNIRCTHPFTDGTVDPLIIALVRRKREVCPQLASGRFRSLSTFFIFFLFQQRNKSVFISLSSNRKKGQRGVVLIHLERLACIKLFGRVYYHNKQLG